MCVEPHTCRRAHVWLGLLVGVWTRRPAFGVTLVMTT